MALFPVSTAGVSKEQVDVLVDVQSTCAEYGDPIIIRLRSESDVVRDKYNSIKKHNSMGAAELNFSANPVQYNPSLKQLEKAGIKEQVEVIVYTAMQDWLDNSLTFDDIDTIRSTVEIDGQEVEIKSKGRSGQYGNTFLYITLGLVRK